MYILENSYGKSMKVIIGDSLNHAVLLELFVCIWSLKKKYLV